MDSASAAGCSAPEARGLAAGPSPLSVGRCHPPRLQRRLESSPARCPRGPSGLPTLWVLRAPQGPTSIRVRSRPRVQNPVAPEVLAAPPPPSPTAIPLPLFHVCPQVGTARLPGQEAPPVEIPPARLHSALKLPLPCPHQRVSPKRHPFTAEPKDVPTGPPVPARTRASATAQGGANVGWTQVRGVLHSPVQEGSTIRLSCRGRRAEPGTGPAPPRGLHPLRTCGAPPGGSDAPMGEAVCASPPSCPGPRPLPGSRKTYFRVSTWSPLKDPPRLGSEESGPLTAVPWSSPRSPGLSLSPALRPACGNSGSWVLEVGGWKWGADTQCLDQPALCSVPTASLTLAVLQSGPGSHPLSQLRKWRPREA